MGKQQKLFSLIKKGAVAAVEELLSPPPSATDLDSLLLYAASFRTENHTKIAATLIIKGAGPDAINAALCISAAAGNAGMADLLLRHGADPAYSDKEQLTALHHAALQGHEPVVRVLIKARAPLNSKDGKGNTPIHLASQHAHLPTLIKLAEAGAEVNTSNQAGMTPLLSAITEVKDPNIRRAIIQHLLFKQADANAVDAASNNALIWACKKKISIEEIKLLLPKISNLNHTNQDGDTALDAAIWPRHVELLEAPRYFEAVQLLLEKGTKITLHTFHITKTLLTHEEREKFFSKDYPGESIFRSIVLGISCLLVIPGVFLGAIKLIEMASKDPDNPASKETGESILKALVHRTSSRSLLTVINNPRTRPSLNACMEEALNEELQHRVNLALKVREAEKQASRELTATGQAISTMLRTVDRQGNISFLEKKEDGQGKTEFTYAPLSPQYTTAALPILNVIKKHRFASEFNTPEQYRALRINHIVDRLLEQAFPGKEQQQKREDSLHTTVKLVEAAARLLGLPVKTLAGNEHFKRITVSVMQELSKQHEVFPFKPCLSKIMAQREMILGSSLSAEAPASASLERLI